MSSIIGHAAVLRELRSLAFSADPPHAILIAGPEGVGRELLVREYLKLLNCERAAPAEPTAGASLFGDELPPAEPVDLPCDVCRQCRLINEGTHPDVITVAPGDSLCRPRQSDSAHAKHPDSRDIRICQVRGIVDLVARYPFEARVRGVVIDPADKITPDAANSMLKTLEEPPGHSVFALITAAPESIIETVLSRCRRVNVRAVARAEIEAGLIARGVPAELAARAAVEARGKPGRAIAFAAQPDLMDDRGRILGRCARLASAGMFERFKHSESLAERYRNDRLPVMVELDAWEAFWEERLRAAASADPAAAREAMQSLQAVTLARADLKAQVMTRGALELMLLSFPRVTLERDSGNADSSLPSVASFEAAGELEASPPPF